MRRWPRVLLDRSGTFTVFFLKFIFLFSSKGLIVPGMKKCLGKIEAEPEIEDEP